MDLGIKKTKQKKAKQNKTPNKTEQNKTKMLRGWLLYSSESKREHGTSSWQTDMGDIVVGLITMKKCIRPFHQVCLCYKTGRHSCYTRGLYCPHKGPQLAVEMNWQTSHEVQQDKVLDLSKNNPVHQYMLQVTQKRILQSWCTTS